MPKFRVKAVRVLYQSLQEVVIADDAIDAHKKIRSILDLGLLDPKFVTSRTGRPGIEEVDMIGEHPDNNKTSWNNVVYDPNA